MLLVILLLNDGLSTSRYWFNTDCPLSEIGDRIRQAALDYLSRVPANRDGLTWGEAMERIPDELWGKYGLTKAQMQPSADLHIENMASAYLIPSKEARLLEAASNITAYLIRYLEADLMNECTVGLLDRITCFVLIWAPRFVDQNLFNLYEFMESALSETSADFWHVAEEEDVDPEEYGARDYCSACI